jgi:FAD/FMN-containing dehydrogenase
MSFLEKITSLFGHRMTELTHPRDIAPYARDASAFAVMPHRVFRPTSTADIVELVQRVRTARSQGEKASLTVRSGGTCMSGGPLSDEWVVDMTGLSSVSIDPKARTATVGGGTYFRDIEDAAARHGLMFAPYPSSRRICGIGGMIGNNASGEKSLRFGPTSEHIAELEVVLAHGEVVRLVPKKISAIAGNRREEALLALYREHAEVLSQALGNVVKAASGYRLDAIVNRGMFHEAMLFAGAQGTLGIVTKAVLNLVPLPTHVELVVITASRMEDISPVLSTVLEHNPESLETFDINTFKKGLTHLREHAVKMVPYIKEDGQLFILAQFSEGTAGDTHAQALACTEALRAQGFSCAHVANKDDAASIWEVRRHSFLLMRDYNEPGMRAIPCIEDVIVPIEQLGTFIAGLHDILNRHHIQYGFHGHIGDGSLRIIPVFNGADPSLADNIAALMDEVFTLVKRLHGNMSADHSDGIIRTPYLRAFYGDRLVNLFEDIKKLYDPENIMNPGKKVGGTFDRVRQYLDVGKR